jgi:hypothetical protein
MKVVVYDRYGSPDVLELTERSESWTRNRLLARLPHRPKMDS